MFFLLEFQEDFLFVSKEEGLLFYEIVEIFYIGLLGEADID